jgi:hypothetical protein
MQKGFSKRDKQKKKQHYIPILTSRKAARGGPQKMFRLQTTHGVSITTITT